MILRIKHYFDQSMEILLEILMLIMTVVVLWQVFTRFVLQHQAFWTEELARYLMIWISFVGAAMGIKYGIHLGLTFIVDRIKNKYIKLVVNIFCYVLCIVFGYIVMVYGYRFMMEGNQKVALSFSFKMVYIYMVVPLSGLILILNSIEQIYLCLKKGIQSKLDSNCMKKEA